MRSRPCWRGHRSTTVGVPAGAIRPWAAALGQVAHPRGGCPPSARLPPPGQVARPQPRCPPSASCPILGHVARRWPRCPAPARSRQAMARDRPWHRGDDGPAAPILPQGCHDVLSLGVHPNRTLPAPRRGIAHPAGRRRGIAHPTGRRCRRPWWTARADDPGRQRGRTPSIPPQPGRPGHHGITNPARRRETSAATSRNNRVRRPWFRNGWWRGARSAIMDGAGAGSASPRGCRGGGRRVPRACGGERDRPARTRSGPAGAASSRQPCRRPRDRGTRRRTWGRGTRRRTWGR